MKFTKSYVVRREFALRPGLWADFKAALTLRKDAGGKMHAVGLECFGPRYVKCMRGISGIIAAETEGVSLFDAVSFVIDLVGADTLERFISGAFGPTGRPARAPEMDSSRLTWEVVNEMLEALRLGPRELERILSEGVITGVSFQPGPGEKMANHVWALLSGPHGWKIPYCLYAIFEAFGDDTATKVLFRSSRDRSP